jgi:hypothetical protein
MKRTSKDGKERKAGARIPRLGPRTRAGEVQPLKAKRARGREYDYGFTPPPERDPWIDEGRPETAG